MSQRASACVCAGAAVLLSANCHRLCFSLVPFLDPRIRLTCLPHRTSRPAMAANGGHPPPLLFACKCLNIRIHPQPHPHTDIPPPVEVAFKSVYVGEDGITVVCSTSDSSSSSWLMRVRSDSPGGHS